MKYLRLVLRLMNIFTSLFILAHLALIMIFGAVEIYETSKPILYAEVVVIVMLIMGNIHQFCSSFEKRH